MKKYFFISNDFRKSRIEGFINQKLFGDIKVIGYYSTNTSKNNLLNIIKRKIQIAFSDVIIISDIENLEVFNSLTANLNKRIYLIMWNSEKELNKIEYLDNIKKQKKIQVCFFFREAAENTKLKLNIDSRYIMSPLLSFTPIKKQIKNQIIYCSEVNIQKHIEKSDPEIDKKLWEYAKKIVFEDSNYLYNENLINEYFHGYLNNELNLSWILKNRMRYLYVKELKDKFKDDFILIGTDWINHGFSAFPTNYDLNHLLNLYSEAKVCIDLLSKSSNEAIFERVTQIISVSSGLLQIKTCDSLITYETLSENVVFKNYAELLEKIKIKFNLDDKSFYNEGKQLKDLINEKCSKNRLVDLN